MNTRSAGRRTNPPNGRTSSNGQAPARSANRLRKATNGRATQYPSRFSEARGQATLQATANARSDRLSVRFAGDQVELELMGRGQLLIQGLWDCVISVDGRPMELTGEWESSCWNADDDADYLELQFRIGDTLRIDRQILLPRSGNFAVLADAIIAPGAKQLEVRTRLPLPSGFKLTTERLTRSAKLRSSDATARIHPLALAQARVNSTSGELTASANAIELVQRQQGSGLYLPFVVDWNPARASASVFWRNLTVSEHGRTLPIDEAAGYRLRMGGEQWLIYHSLHNTNEARAILGHHTWNETVIGSFRADGTVAPLILIEQA